MATQSLSGQGSTGGPSLGGTDGVWPLREECRREGLSVAWSVASFSSWKKTALCKVEEIYSPSKESELK